MSLYIEPQSFATAVRDRLYRSEAEVNAYWLQVSGNRDDYAEKLRDELETDPVVVLIVRDISFDNPNSVLADLIKIMNKNRTACERAARARPGNMQFGILLLARTQLSVSQASSMVPLPDWFPVLGGQYLPIIIEDLTWTAEAPLNCVEGKMGEICERLYELEGVILRRLVAAYEIDRQCATALLPIMRRGDGEQYRQLLELFEQYRNTVNVATAFRPSRREGGSLISRLWDLAQRRAPEGMNDLVKALTAALDLSDASPGVWQESFASVLCRPANRNSSSAQRVVRDVLVTIATSCQFITVAAHAEDYGTYPIPLLVSFSYDLRRALLSAEMALRV